MSSQPSLAEHNIDSVLVNLGKWVLRYLFSGLIDTEIKRDTEYRKTLEDSLPAGNLQQPVTSPGQLPSRTVEGLTPDDEDTESITTPKPTNNGLPAITPGLSIGVASPGPFQVMSNGSVNLTKTPGTTDDKSRPSGDYFSTRPLLPPPNMKTSDTATETTFEAAVSPNDGDEKTKSPSLFGKKFRLPLKMLGRTSVEVPKPSIVEDRVEESDKSTEKEEISIEDNMFGVVQRIRLQYEEQLQQYPNNKLLSTIAPSLPSETPVIKPPSSTAILIQEDAPESGGLADLYRGTVGSVARDADKIEKVAPVWLGELLLKVSK